MAQSNKINDISKRLDIVNQLTCESDLVNEDRADYWNLRLDLISRFIKRGWIVTVKEDAAEAIEECIRDYKDSALKDAVISVLNEVVNIKHVYTVLQGSKENGSDNLDMNEHGVFTNKKEAMKAFNHMKHQTSGWCGDILVTELWMDCDEEEEYNFCPIASHEEDIK